MLTPGRTPYGLQPEIITLREFEACEVAFSDEVYAALRARYTGRIDIAPAERPGMYRIAARDYVGRVGLPGGGMLVIQPKVAVANLFYMLCADAGLAEIKPPPMGLASANDNLEIVNFVVAALLGAVERLLNQGLYRGYVSRQESLASIRGRIALGEQVSRYGELKHRHVCAFAELNIDTAENRIMLAALRDVPRVLTRDRQADVSLLRQARSHAARLEVVRQVSRNEAIGLLRNISMHRLNAAYGPVLSLCRLVLQHLTFEGRSGPYPFASFLVNMPRLFETFLTVRLRTLLQQYGLRAVAQRPDYLDEERTIGIRPDLLVLDRQGKAPLVVVDFKYRALDEPGASANSDLYQLSAYMDRYNLRAGMLVYPHFETMPRTRLKLRGTPKHIHLASFDLGAATPAELEGQCGTVAGKIAELAADAG